MEGEFSFSGTSYIGGIAGYISGGKLKSVINDIRISGTGVYGGICGYAKGVLALENCENKAIIKGLYAGGLIGMVSTGNISIKESKNNGNCEGTYYSGGLVGMNYGSSLIFDSCKNEGSVSGNTVGGITGYNYSGQSQYDLCQNSGSITGKQTTGGILGGYKASGPISFKDCYNSGNITSGGHIGGICGFLIKGFTSHCINTGTITQTNPWGGYFIGGIIGCNDASTIINCANYGNVNASGDAFIGGIAGGNGYYGTYFSSGGTAYSLIYNSYNSGNVSGPSNYVGGIAGAHGYPGPVIDSESREIVIDNCYSRGMLSGYDVSGIAGKLFFGTITNSYYQKTGNQHAFSYGSDGVKTDDILKNIGFIDAGERTLPTVYENDFLTYEYDSDGNQIDFPIQSETVLLTKLRDIKLQHDEYLPWVIAQNHNDFYPVFGMPVTFSIKPNGNEGYEEIQTSIESYNHDDYELGDHVYYFADTDTVSFAAKENTGFRFIEAKYVDGEKFISEQTASENNFSFKMGAFPVEIELWYDSQQIVRIVKIWNDANYESNQRPLTLNTQLVIGSVAQADVNGNTVFQLTEDPDTHAWTKTVYLPAKDYSTLRATEEEIPGYEQEDYSRSTASDGTLIFTFTNKRTVVPVENYVVTKVWKGTNPAGNRQLPRPEITVILFADGVEYERKVIQAGAADPVTVRFDSIPKYKDGNTLIQYMIREEITDSDWVKVGENEWYSLDGMGKYTGYIESTSADDGNTENQTDEIRETATNIYAALQSTTSADVIKHWEDHQNENSIRPVCVKLGLFLPGAADPLAAVTLKGAENADAWNGTFNELPLYDESGRIIDYSTCIVMEAYPETYHDDGTPATWGAWIDDGEQVLVEKDGMTYTYDYSAATP
ncbi:MAG: Cna B-type domain-containing protein [Clostridia bacterium]|nr:Cna B-type domain-containing protein [Clostridia bacterium]